MSKPKVSIIGAAAQITLPNVEPFTAEVTRYNKLTDKCISFICEYEKGDLWITAQIFIKKGKREWCGDSMLVQSNGKRKIQKFKSVTLLDKKMFSGITLLAWDKKAIVWPKA